jgi:hypothetical protein
MQLHGTSTKYICLSSTLYTSLLVLGGGIPCNLFQVISNTLEGKLAFGETTTSFYKFVQLDSGEPNTVGSSNRLSNYPFIMGNQFTKKEGD